MDRYRLIGEAYVHGLMLGEVILQDSKIERIGFWLNANSPFGISQSVIEGAEHSGYSRG
ncbi:hypothetical protein K432DRAFT_384559 [Lepidopterella palustris CBS 459.81]|uniref:Uncharacterized protein n=1 Tax=Lepidopterella palustris CBS 459.81 TaxID=1314670 RepID=A0A8E2E552_9PEZI|nr:hypothetical protein K432DRAFT_384559 [Lepidopterella palustris CBS 459.81]